jgi:hypothetical protein
MALIPTGIERRLSPDGHFISVDERIGLRQISECHTYVTRAGQHKSELYELAKTGPSRFPGTVNLRRNVVGGYTITQRISNINTFRVKFY